MTSVGGVKMFCRDGENPFTDSDLDEDEDDEELLEEEQQEEGQREGRRRGSSTTARPQASSAHESENGREDYARESQGSEFGSGRVGLDGVDLSPIPPYLDLYGVGGGAPPPVPPPQSATGDPVIWPGPDHISSIAAPLEPFLRPRSDLVDAVFRDYCWRLDHTDLTLNRLVYEYAASSSLYGKPAAGSTSGKKQGWRVKPYYTPVSKEDTTLVFESRFESGNLRKAVQVFEYEYDLTLQFDINTKGHTQWFYFAVLNARPGIVYKFNIVNLMKPNSLFNGGMQPLVYSTRDAYEQGVGWMRGGNDVCYYQNRTRRKGGFYHTLTFTCEFANEGDVYYLAMCYPYTYTDLRCYLGSLEADPQRASTFTRRVLCNTLAGNPVDLLTITSPGDPEAIARRKGIVLTARVHPGESNASWMMKGCIDYLTSPSLDAQILRDNFVFKVVPMLNPDGVIHGNYRCSMAGVDLNRRWKEPSKKLNPTIFYTKSMIRRFKEERSVLMCCDFHGHSRKHNIFIYGCENDPSSPLYLRERVFPKLLSENSHIFSFADCDFKVQRSKEATARVVLKNDFNIVNSFTMEASFCGANINRFAGLQFTTAQFESMGHCFCDSILDYCDPDQSKVVSISRQLAALFPPSEFASSSSVGGRGSGATVQSSGGADVDGEDSDSPSDADTDVAGSNRGRKKASGGRTKGKSASGGRSGKTKANGVSQKGSSQGSSKSANSVKSGGSGRSGTSGTSSMVKQRPAKRGRNKTPSRSESQSSFGSGGRVGRTGGSRPLRKSGSSGAVRGGAKVGKRGGGGASRGAVARGGTLRGQASAPSVMGVSGSDDGNSTYRRSNSPAASQGSQGSQAATAGLAATGGAPDSQREATRGGAVTATTASATTSAGASAAGQKSNGTTSRRPNGRQRFGASRGGSRRGRGGSARPRVSRDSSTSSQMEFLVAGESAQHI